jgi:hypothetical protein
MNYFMMNSKPFPVMNMSVQVALRRRSTASSKIETVDFYSSSFGSGISSTTGAGIAPPGRGGA